MSADALTMDELTHVLSNERRRRVVRIIDTEGPHKLRALADLIASREAGVPVGDAPHDGRKACYIALYQNHLEKLDDVGIVEWDGESRDPITAGINLDIAVKTLDQLEIILNGEDNRGLGATIRDALPTFRTPSQEPEIATDGGVSDAE